MITELEALLAKQDRAKEPVGLIADPGSVRGGFIGQAKRQQSVTGEFLSACLVSSDLQGV